MPDLRDLLEAYCDARRRQVERNHTIELCAQVADRCNGIPSVYAGHRIRQLKTGDGNA